MKDDLARSCGTRISWPAKPTPVLSHRCLAGTEGGGKRCRGAAAGGWLLTRCQEREPLSPSALPVSWHRAHASGLATYQGQTTSGFMIEAPLDRGKWRKEMKKRWRRGAGLRGELTRKIWHLARLPHGFCRLPPFVSHVPAHLPLLSPR